MGDRSYASTAADNSGSGSPGYGNRGDHSSSKESSTSNEPSRSHNGSNRDPNHDRGRGPSPTSAKANGANGGAYSAAEYQRSSYHIPKTRPNRESPSPNGDREDHYILTFLTDESLHRYMTSLRRKYFPSHINKIDAHVTLFHALPSSHLGEIVQDIRELCERESPFGITAEKPFGLYNKIIMVNASSPRFAIQGVQKLLKEKWAVWLSEQDAGKYRPHYTLLNKVDDPKEVEAKLRECKDEFESKDGEVKGLVLWRYERGFWKDRKVFEFGKRDESGSS